ACAGVRLAAGVAQVQARSGADDDDRLLRRLARAHVDSREAAAQPRRRMRVERVHAGGQAAHRDHAVARRAQDPAAVVATAGERALALLGSSALVDDARTDLATGPQGELDVLGARIDDDRLGFGEAELLTIRIDAESSERNRAEREAPLLVAAVV